MGETRRRQAADWALTACAAAGLCAALYAGFVLEDPLCTSGPASLLLCAALEAGLALLGSALPTAAGVGASLALAAAWVACGRLLRPQGTWFLTVSVTLLAAVAVYWLSRTRGGAAVLFLGGSLVAAGSHFLAFPAPLWGLLLFAPAALALFLRRVCTAAARRAEVGTGAARCLGQVCALTLAALTAACGVYWFVVRPADPPTQELRLIETLRSMELLRVLGVSSVQTVTDPELLAQEPPQQEETASDPGQEMGETVPPEEAGDEADVPSTQWEDLEAVSYPAAASRLWLLAVLAAFLAAGVLAGRRLRRRRWLARLRAMPPEEAVVCCYRFSLARLRRLGLPRASNETLREYAAASAERLRSLTPQEDFAALTAVYERVVYGGLPVTAEERRRFESYCESLRRCRRRQVRRAGRSCYG